MKPRFRLIPAAMTLLISLLLTRGTAVSYFNGHTAPKVNHFTVTARVPGTFDPGRLSFFHSGLIVSPAGIPPELNNRTDIGLPSTPSEYDESLTSGSTATLSDFIPGGRAVSAE